MPSIFPSPRTPGNLGTTTGTPRSGRPLLPLLLALLLAALLLPAVACGPDEDETAAPETASAEPASMDRTRPEPAPEYPVQAFLDNTALFGLAVSPDGQRVAVSSDQDGMFNVWVYPTAGGEPTQLTRSETDATFPVDYLPDGERLLISRDQGGNELNHLYVLSPDGSERDLTPGEGLKADFASWNEDRSAFYVTTNERDQRYFDLYRYDAETFEREMIYENTRGWTPGSVSPDGRWVAVEERLGSQDANIHLVDTESGETHLLTPHEGEVMNLIGPFTPDSSGLLALTDEGREFTYLVRHDIAASLAAGEAAKGGEDAPAARPRPEVLVQEDWDVRGAWVSDSGRYLSTLINRDSATELRLYQVDPAVRSASLEAIDLPDLEGLEITSMTVSPDDRHLAFYAESSRTPENLYLAPLSGGEVRQLSNTQSPDIDPEQLADGKVVRFASYDGVEIPGILYRPHGSSAENKVPAVVWVHGGPGGQSRIGYSDLQQILVNRGIAVYAINNRGSDGYGKTFHAMDDQRHGEADLDDVVASKKMLADTGWIDGDRIAVLGGSYGGYMTLAALTFRPEEFAAGVDLWGISNWQRTLESIPPWWESARQALYQEMGDPEKDSERLRRISPLFHADQIRRPLMVIQGANDPRVLQVESDDIVEAVRANGLPVEYLVFEDEGHGLSSRENRLEAYGAIADFLETHLAVGGTGTDSETGSDTEAAAES